MKNEKVIQAIESALSLLNNEVQCVVNETLKEEYEGVIEDISEALKICNKK